MMPPTLGAVSNFGTFTLADQGLLPYIRSCVPPIDSALTDAKAEVEPPRKWARDEDRMMDAGDTIDMSPWMTDVLPTVERLRDLPDNWDSYGSPPPPNELITNVLMLLNQAWGEDKSPHARQATMPTPSIVPLSGGGIQVEWHLMQRELELEFYEDQPVSALAVETSTEDCAETTFDVDDHESMRHLLAWLVGQF